MLAQAAVKHAFPSPDVFLAGGHGGERIRCCRPARRPSGRRNHQCRDNGAPRICHRGHQRARCRPAPRASSRYERPPVTSAQQDVVMCGASSSFERPVVNRARPSAGMLTARGRGHNDKTPGREGPSAEFSTGSCTLQVYENRPPGCQEEPQRCCDKTGSSQVRNRLLGDARIIPIAPALHTPICHTRYG